MRGEGGGGNYCKQGYVIDQNTGFFHRQSYCVAAVKRLPALHYSVDFIFLSFGIMGYIVEL